MSNEGHTKLTPERTQINVVLMHVFFSLDSPTSREQHSPTPSNMLEEVNVQYLKELQEEKESLGTNVTGHALKLLENGK